MNIQAITFDVGGTLIEPSPSVGHVYAALAAEHGVKGILPAQLNESFARAWQARNHFDYSQPAWFELVRQTFGEVAPRLPESFFPAVYQRFAGPEVWHIYPDVLPVLDQLASRGVKLGIISNWDERLEPLLQQLSLRDYFEAVAISCEVGFTKPSPVIFEYAARKLGLPAGVILHIGDSDTEDEQGARAAGFLSMRLRRDGHLKAGEVRSLESVVPEATARWQ